MTYTTTVDPLHADVTLLTLGPVTFRVRGADLPGATVGAQWTSQIEQIAAGLELIPASHHADIAPAEIRIRPGRGGSSFNFAGDFIVIHDLRFAATFNERTFQSLIHECGHSFDKRRRATSHFRESQAAGAARENTWEAAYTGQVPLHWVPGESPTFPAASPPDDWDHFRAIAYSGRNRIRRTGLPTHGESFAEGYMKVICAPLHGRLTPDQTRILRAMAPGL